MVSNPRTLAPPRNLCGSKVPLEQAIQPGYCIFCQPIRLLTCDGGGSNSSRSYLFKAALQALAIELGIDIRIAHYPPYTSKYNPIEHRLFPHLTRATQGVIFDTVDTVKDLMATVTTATGLSVFTTVLDQVYEIGKKATDELKASIQIVFDDVLPKWNYTALANPSQIGSTI